MENKLAINPLAPVLGVSPSPAPPSPASNLSLMQRDVADLRLVIEEDAASGLYIYKTVDRRTGDVVLELPRAEVVRMYRTADYQAGAIIKAKV